jgi:hypothetical protein
MNGPYLSFVLASRNDDHGGGMLRRLQVCLNGLLEQAERHKLNSEVVLVDWNPPHDRAPLADALEWPEHTDHCTFRLIEVPASVHRRLRFSDKLPFLLHTAWNVGIRRARGKFLLPTTNDTMHSDPLVEFLVSECLESDRLYRIDRHDVPESLLQLRSIDERLAFAHQHVQEVHDRKGSSSIKGHNPGLHTNAAGDFLLLSSNSWWKLHGIPEEAEFHSANFDSLTCYMAYAAGIRQEVLGEPMRLYHLNHVYNIRKPTDDWLRSWLRGWRRRLPVPNRWTVRLAKVGDRIVPARSDLERIGVPRIGKGDYQDLVIDILNGRRSYVYNGDTWGLGAERLPDTFAVPAAWDSLAPVRRN